MTALRTKERWLFVVVGLTAVVIFLFPFAAKAAEPTERDRVMAAIHHASGEFGVDEAKTIRVGRCESGLREDPHDSPAYGGTMQQARRYWQARVRSFNQWARAHGHETMSGQIGVAIDNLRLSLWMVSQRGNWGDWPQCGRR